MSQRGHMRRWRDVGEGDIKIFLHMIAMGLVRKACLEKYWDHGEIVKTAFFRDIHGQEYFSNYSVKFSSF